MAMPETTVLMNRATAIVPAHNEENRIGAVLAAIRACSLVGEVIVVCDGCDDGTAAAARAGGADRVIELPKNIGKGGAMLAGVRVARSEVVAFLDADLIGLRSEHVERLVAPVLAGEAATTVGLFRGAAFWSDMAQALAPALSGQRSMRRVLFETAPIVEQARMGIETSLVVHFRRRRARVLRVPFDGVSHVSKERKLGWWRGLRARLAMYRDIVLTLWQLRHPEFLPVALPLEPRWKPDQP
jgi:glycosyltransferase involved in cell wall biosynthesis